MKVLKLACGVLLLAGLSTVSAAELVSNGDLELSNIGPVFFKSVPAGDNSLTNWIVTSPVSGAGIDIVTNRTGQTQFVNTGQQAVDLAGTPGPASITQTLTTVAGANYTLSFSLSSNGTEKTNGVTVLWGGTPVATLSSPALGTWTPFSYLLTATGTSTALTFQGNISGNQGSLLDTISVQDAISGVPEPATFALVGAALLLVRKLRR